MLACRLQLEKQRHIFAALPDFKDTRWWRSVHPDVDLYVSTLPTEYYDFETWAPIDYEIFNNATRY